MRTPAKRTPQFREAARSLASCFKRGQASGREKEVEELQRGLGEKKAVMENCGRSLDHPRYLH